MILLIPLYVIEIRLFFEIFQQKQNLHENDIPIFRTFDFCYGHEESG